MFYIGYVLVELPSNILIRRVGPANWLSFLGLFWGVATLGIGFSQNWVTLTVLRVILGLFEGGLFPGCVYLLGSWYKAGELQKRIAAFFLTASFLSSFSNILAYGLVHISHDPFVSGWRWIFIVEGALTSVIGLLSWFIVIDFPRSKRNKFLTAEETSIVEARLLLERGEDEGEKVNSKVILETVKDWKVWVLYVIPRNQRTQKILTSAVPLYSKLARRVSTHFFFFFQLSCKKDLASASRRRFCSVPRLRHSVLLSPSYRRGWRIKRDFVDLLPLVLQSWE